MPTNIVFSCQADYRDIALREILDAIPSVGFVKWIDGGVGLLEYPGPFAEFSALVKEKNLIFLRHIFLAEYMIPYADMETPEYITPFIPRMDKGASFSVQIRSADGNSQYDLSKIKQIAADHLKAEGFTENKRYPEQIISIFISNGLAYTGLSRADDNLSIWSGGMRHYAMRDDTVSRAGFKLMEALEACPIVFRENGAALDLGAAPGGWTKVLLDHGFRVTAVDPVKLSSILQAHRNVQYYGCKAHEYIRGSDKKFDLIVNDMSMNITDSVKFMLSLKNRLRGGGHIIMTFKLTKHDRLNRIKEGLRLLSTSYTVLFVKQLFHNRSEVTVILQQS